MERGFWQMVGETGLDSQGCWLVEGQECQAQGFVHHRLVFMAAAYGWADGTLNKGSQPGGHVKAESAPSLLSSEPHILRWREDAFP